MSHMLPMPQMSEEQALLPPNPASEAAHLSAMQAAYAQAQLAYALGEVPVGAVVVDSQGQVLAQGHNRVITDQDPTAHAEIVALRAAARIAGNYRLPDYHLYVTLEPCAMCLGAMLHARLRAVVFGAPDPKTGACGGLMDLARNRQLNHQTQIIGGVLAEPCGALLRRFFRERRGAPDLPTRPPAPQSTAHC